MENNLHTDDQLFRAINDRLSNYEAPHEGANWDAMSRSLNQLPKSTRMAFKWKPSLNSILVIVGIVGVSLLGYAFVGGKNGKVNTASTNIPVVKINTNITAPVTPVQNVVMTNNSNPIVQHNTSVLNDNAAMTNVNHAVTGSFHRYSGDAGGNGLRFGDQIDPRKGFIYQTQENNTLVGSHTDSIPSTYYDMVGGQHKTIHLNPDSANHHKQKSATDPATDNGAPTGQELTGFDVQLN